MEVTPHSSGSENERPSTRVGPLILVGIIASLVTWLLPLAFQARQAVSTPAARVDDGWVKVGSGMLRGVSGIELFPVSGADPAFLIAHDSKAYTDGPNPEPRVALLRRRGNEISYSPIPWPTTEPPSDLEALAVIPGATRSFAALTSKGELYALTFDEGGTSLQIVHRTTVPNPEKKLEFEAFEIATVGGATFAIWIDRGDSVQPGRMFWAPIDLGSMVIAPDSVQAADLRVPWPTAAARPVSDAKVDGAGTLFISSSCDPGDAGPFASAVYSAGSFHLGGSGIDFHPNPQLTRLYVTDGHKIEALALWPGPGGGLVLGTDDELAGGALWIAQ